MDPMKYNFTNYFDLKNIERRGSWDKKQAAKRELEKRETKRAHP